MSIRRTRCWRRQHFQVNTLLGSRVSSCLSSGNACTAKDASSTARSDTWPKSSKCRKCAQSSNAGCFGRLVTKHTAEQKISLSCPLRLRWRLDPEPYGQDSMPRVIATGSMRISPRRGSAGVGLSTVHYLGQYALAAELTKSPG